MDRMRRLAVIFIALSVCIFTFSSCSSGSKIELSSALFLESDSNDGTIGNEITATLTGMTFRAETGVLTADEDYTLTGGTIPAGLTFAITITSATTAQLSLTGTATSHDSTDGVTGLKLQFLKAAFSGGSDSDEFDLGVICYSPNKLNGTYTGGVAKVVAITAHMSGTEYTDGVYRDDLGMDCSYSWYPQGTLCDEATTTDYLGTSTKTNYDSGATWDAIDESSAPITGVLIIDACSDDSCETIGFNTAKVFQMFSDGKVSDIRFYTHQELSNTPPAWDDTGWEAVDAFQEVGAGVDSSEDGLVVTEPTTLSFDAKATRYLKIEVINDAAYDEGDWIELRSVKLFMATE